MYKICKKDGKFEQTDTRDKNKLGTRIDLPNAKKLRARLAGEVE